MSSRCSERVPRCELGPDRVFSDSRKLDTCPYLRDHSEPVWATCVPVSIAGRTTGVIHAEDSTDVPPSDELAPELELLARKAGERMGVLRVLARTEAQAQVDPLTGLPNRRTLEHRTHDLVDSDAGFVVAFADLDHFKDLNDLHGHDTGDRALRLFAACSATAFDRTTSRRATAVKSSWWCSPTARSSMRGVVAERIRARLADTLEGANVPPFTVSVGLAAAEPHEAVSEVIERADGALLKAKQLGRDRVLAAGQILDPEAIIDSDRSSARVPTRPRHETRKRARPRGRDRRAGRHLTAARFSRRRCVLIRDQRYAAGGTPKPARPVEADGR